MKKHFILFFVATSPFFLWGTYFEAYGLEFPENARKETGHA